jgi:hypothetical protein
VQLAVGARPRDRAGVPDAVAGPETGDVGADALDDADGVPAQHLGLAGRRRDIAAHLGVDRVDRDGLDAHEQVARAGLRGGHLEILEGARLVHGQVLAVSDGFHGRTPVVDTAIVRMQAGIDKMAWIGFNYK